MQILENLQHRFYNISRIMDCVSCDKCRLNGKLQVRGLATALKVLFLPDTHRQQVIKNLKSGEIISLVNLLRKLSESLRILDKFTEVETKVNQRFLMMNRSFATFVSIICFYVLVRILHPNRRKTTRKVDWFSNFIRFIIDSLVLVIQRRFNHYATRHSVPLHVLALFYGGHQLWHFHLC